MNKEATISIPISLAAKLGSIARHAEELISPKGHAFDRTVLHQLLQDKQVTDWLKQYEALMPVLR